MRHVGCRPPGTARGGGGGGGGQPCSMKPSAVLAGLPSHPAPGCLASFPRRPSANCFPRRGETGRDTCAPSAAAPGPPRVPAITPRSCPTSSPFFPSHPSFALARGRDPVPPFPPGRRRWRGAKVRWGVLGARLVPGRGGKDAGLPGTAVPSAATAPAWALPSPCLSPSAGQGTAGVPLPRGRAREGWRTLGWPGDGHRRRGSLFRRLGLVARLAGVSWEPPSPGSKY